MHRSKLILVVLAAVLSLLNAGSAAAGGKHATALTVKSTLAGKKTLPHRIRWVAAPSDKVFQVEFVIDGKVRWTEHMAPYAFGSEGNWLVTSWLAPGMHRFMVRVHDFAGMTAVETVRARVLPAPAAPSQLSGSRWSRNFTKSEVSNGSPAGTWKITIDNSGWKMHDPNGGTNYLDVAYLSPGLLEVRSGIWTRHPTPAEDANGGAHIQEGNGWCHDTNQPVRYRWSVDGSTLTLALAGPKRCDGQSDIWANDWTRGG